MQLRGKKCAKKGRLAYCILACYNACKQSQVVSFTGTRDSFIPGYHISLISVEYVCTIILGIILVLTGHLVCHIIMVSNGSHGMSYYYSIK